MTDMRKTKMFRWAVFLVVFPLAILALAVADDVIWRIVNYAFGERWAPKYAVEVLTFIFLLTSRIWDWLDRRVWIGSSPQQNT